ncbi:hypothetical protein PIROE2DRAFT_9539 [Piromyces sp. E2]|nr:hypothetical protein PIROE2DRAFT_9539 [Piromyces sp. E2]|eukprot:OUM63869.1 hypothetical protein PIROE2DRAFT_9539 [Piromyces sp. E2]
MDNKFLILIIVNKELPMENDLDSKYPGNKSKEIINALELLKKMKNEISSGDLVSGIPSLYEDEQVCSTVNCEAYRNVQPIRKVNTYPYDEEEYYYKYTNYIYDYLYRNKSISEVLDHLDDLSKINHISMDVRESFLGIGISILLVIIILLMMSSLLFLVVKKCKIQFVFLSNDFWILLIIGLTLILSIGFSLLGRINPFKCLLCPSLLGFGYSFFLIPILHKLITGFPEHNKISFWIEHHKYLFLLFFIVMDTCFVTSLALTGYDIGVVLHKGSENYEKCHIKNWYGSLILYLFMGYKLGIFLVLLLLLYIEWNIDIFHNDIRCFTTTIYIDGLSIILLTILKHISINNYTVNILIEEIIITVAVISNYMLLFGYRTILSFTQPKEEVKLYINTVNDLGDYSNKAYYSSNISSQFDNNNNTSSNSKTEYSTSNKTGSTLLLKIKEYHNRKNIN